MKAIGALTILLVPFIQSFASDLRIEGVEWSRDYRNDNKVKFTLAWNNSWRNDKNYDAVWIFLKFTPKLSHGGSYMHIRPSRPRLLNNHVSGSPNPNFEMPEDRTGFFAYPSSRYRGNIRWTIEAGLDTAIFNRRNFNPNDWNINVYGIEMVNIPQGAFTIGEADTTAAWRNFSFFASDGNGRPGGHIRINAEKEVINISKDKGSLYYNSGTPYYNGDQKGPVPAEFPKGFDAFYIMKYEITQGQYASFLNSLSDIATIARVNFGGREYSGSRGSIRLENGSYIAGSPNRPCNFISWDDACAYADWAGLRPMTELEFEKACRGTLQPISHEFPWNTDNKDKLQRIVNKDDELILINGLNESGLNDSNRDQYGASFYWVMDLAGSLWERCVTIGDSTGRTFKGTMGDGALNYFGFANNRDWPSGSTETTGFGFRGGGYYHHDSQLGDFNPHSPIGYRNFGSWPGGARSVAYSSRFVRTSISSTIVK